MMYKKVNNTSASLTKKKNQFITKKRVQMVLEE